LTPPLPARETAVPADRTAATLDVTDEIMGLVAPVALDPDSRLAVDGLPGQALRLAGRPLCHFAPAFAWFATLRCSASGRSGIYWRTVEQWIDWKQTTMLNKTALTVLGMALVGAAGAPASAQTTAPAESGRWTLTVAPYLWATSLEGNTSSGGVDADVDLPFNDIVDNLAFGGMLGVDVRKGRFGVIFDGVVARQETESDIQQVELDMTVDSSWLGVAPYYRVVDWTYRQSASGQPLRFVVEPLAGLRYTHFRVETDGTGPRGNGRQVDRTENWTDPLVGTRFAVDLADQWQVFGEGDIGGFGVGSDLAWNVQAFVGYATTILGRPTTFAAGYRALGQDYENDDFEWDVITHGPVLGAVMRF
jgi:hypothetical protein